MKQDKEQTETFESVIRQGIQYFKCNPIITKEELIERYKYLKQLHDEEIELISHNCEYLNFQCDKCYDKVSILNNKLKEKDAELTDLQGAYDIALEEINKKNKEIEELKQKLKNGGLI